DMVSFSSENHGRVGTYEVVGHYSLQQDSSLPSPNFLMTSSAFETAMVYYQDPIYNWQTQYEFEYQYQTDDKAKAIDDLEALGFEAYDIYQMNRDNYTEERALALSGRIVTLLVILGGIVLFIFFVMKTSMINRVREIGIYRAIGATKKDVYKVFLSEIIVYTTLVSVVGYLFSSYLLMSIERQVNQFRSVFYLPFWLLMLGLIGIYLVNILFGLLPVFNLLRKTPAQILAKYDI
ncbi:MAG TPA: ABC transporter permease, partial [Candidatus Izemoplasmatales bacterium]|nr:ABC transporter permease [Candidatus Izemoplasmatales bacterium]